MRDLELHLRVFEVSQRAKAPRPLKGRDSRLLHRVRIYERLYCILIRTCRHQQIARIHMHHWVLRVSKYESLEIHKSQVIVSQ